MPRFIPLCRAGLAELRTEKPPEYNPAFTEIDRAAVFDRRFAVSDRRFVVCGGVQPFLQGQGFILG